LNTKYTLIPEGKYKGKRLYSEKFNNNIDMMQTEMYFLFQHAFKQNYKIFYIHSKRNHNIRLSEEELVFFKTSIKLEDVNLYLKHNFSNEALEIKKLQYQDLLQLYNLAIKTDNIGSIFTYPKLDEGFYCFDFLLIVKENFNLNDILDVNFNTIKVYSIVEYHSVTITIE
jgi:hypothetical protein